MPTGARPGPGGWQFIPITARRRHRPRIRVGQAVGVGGGGGGAWGVADPAARRRRREGGWLAGACAHRTAPRRRGDRPADACCRLFPSSAPSPSVCAQKKKQPPKAAGFRVLRGSSRIQPAHVGSNSAVACFPANGAVRAATRGFRGFKHGTRTTHRLETKQDCLPICCVFRAMLPVCTPYARRHRHHEVLDGGVCFEWRPRRRRFVPVRSGRRGLC